MHTGTHIQVHTGTHIQVHSGSHIQVHTGIHIQVHTGKVCITLVDLYVWLYYCIVTMHLMYVCITVVY